MLVLLYSDDQATAPEELVAADRELRAKGVATVWISDKRCFREVATRCDALVTSMDVVKIEQFLNEMFPQLKLPIYPAASIASGALDVESMKSWTEIHAPQQVQSFMEHIMEMYRVHLAKNHDYSPANITGPGMIGIATRMWDKIVRIMNLTGFSITAEHLGFEKPRRAVNEPYMDAFMDVAVYGVIAQIFQEGKWGK